MTNRTIRALTLGLLASTALAQPALGQDSPAPTDPADQPSVAAAQTAPDDRDIIVVTAQKREENLQDVPISVQAIGTRRLDQLNIANFEDYTKQLPSVAYQTAQPGLTVVYMRGVASGGDGNHSGSLPSVGTYLDEQPVTTIGGTLDIHIYDIARIESLAGPQGTLYGASSQAGTIRIITNKPELGVTSGRVDAEINKVAHGGWGGKLDGMVNLPISERMAFRGVAFYQRDAGYIDNVFRERSYYVFDDDVADITIDNADLAKKNHNDQRIYGGRAALKVDLDDNWTVTPTVFHQNLKADGFFAYDPNIGDLKIDRYFDEVRKDRFTQAALTIEGKIANFDITYAGAYLNRKTYTLSDYSDYADTYDALYADYNPDYGGLAYFYYLDGAGNFIDPRQYIIGTDHFKKLSQEIRIASPADRPFRVIAGAFYQRQSNQIHQDYRVDDLAPELSVNGLAGTLWLTEQNRVDKDYALFGEASFDVTPQVTITAGGRLFKYDNTLIGFFGFGRNPGDGGDGPFSAFPRNGAGSSRTGVAQCFTESGERLYDRDTDSYASDRTLLPGLRGAPCTNLAEYEDGKLKPKRAKGSGFTHRLNATYKPNDDLMFYGTWSRGFRPGGLNRRADIAPYDPDYLTNFEVGWKTTLADGRLRWNGAVYHQKWNKFQFSFLGANSFTEIQNGSDARINGVETDVSYAHRGLTINAAAAYTDAKTTGTICAANGDEPPCPDSFVAAEKGTRLPITPRLKGSVTARYSWPVMAAARAHVQAGVAYQGSAPATLRTQILWVGTGGIVNPREVLGKIRASTLVDVAGGISWQRYNIELYVANLFDKRNDLSRFVTCSSCFQTKILPGTPRTIGLRVGTRF
ncbi:TonB-dependent receptor [Sphingomonas xanthus]|uniref:TonB-dependent receptor n=1 Tax=Sphingomonas xanthus TaxID=2594473 RepID=A0A516ITA5_9SPHN|nr:TonB-dependent receptor [Sphingomonas xanthus]QDP20152.1 TonB-dependent receptor [Sphingomonas xanthus]